MKPCSVVNVYCGGHHKPGKPRRILCRLAVAIGSILFAATSKGKFMFTLPDDKTASATVAYVDAKGNPATVEGAPVWSSSDETLITVAAAPDGMSAVVSPVGPLGAAQVRITADANLGAGVSEIITLADVEVVGGQAVAGNVTLTLDA
jgi:hypothetical protein